jgi:hypothetical protein
LSEHRGGQGKPSSSDTGEAAGQDVLAVQMGELARSLQQEDTLQDTLQGIVAAAVDTVPGAQYAGISKVKGRREINTPASTDELVRASDAAQYKTGQGPCLDAIMWSRRSGSPIWPARIAGRSSRSRPRSSEWAACCPSSST